MNSSIHLQNEENICPKYDLRFSWSCASLDREAKDAICVTNDSDRSANLEDDIEADQCILLRANGESELPLELRLSLETGARHVITGFTILSEARNIEVYDHKNDYVCTVRSVLVERVDEDFVVYRSHVRLEQSMSGSCTVKFLSLRSPTEMWLYGGVFQVSPQEMPQTLASGFGHIVARMQEQNGTTNLSDNARRFAELVCASSGSSLPPASSTLPTSMLSMMAMLGVKQPSARTSAPTLTQSTGQTREVDPPPSSNKQIPITAENDLQTSIRQMEEHLWAKIEARLDAQERRQNEKLDLIVTLLQNRTLPAVELKNSPPSTPESHTHATQQ